MSASENKNKKTPSHTHSFQTDILIIGSGFGGAIAASELIKTGLDVTVVERGPWRDTKPVKSLGVSEGTPLPSGVGILTGTVRSLNQRFLPKNGLLLNSKGLLECGSYQGSNTLCASAVGGGSHVYGGLLERSPDKSYWNGVSESLSEKAIQPHYDNVASLLRPYKPTSNDNAPNYPPNTCINSPLFESDEDTQPPMGIYFPNNTTQSNEDYEAERAPTKFTGDSVFGSYSGSKTSLDFAVLDGAIRQGLRVLSMCEVVTVASSNDGYDVTVKNLKSGNTLVFTSKKVVLAAGTMNTVKLLFRSRPGLSAMPALGLGFGTNGDFAGYWRCQHGDSDYSRGTPCHGRVSLKGIDDCPDLILANIGLPEIRSRLIPNFIQRQAQKTKHDLMVVGMGADAGDGQFTFKNGRMDVQYNPDNSPIFGRIRLAFKRIMEQSGSRVYYGKKPATVHQYGGARISDSDTEGVISPLGEVYNNPGLYIVDASSLPKAVGGPPSLTVAAWSSHVSTELSRRIKAEPNPTKEKSLSMSASSLVGMKFKELDELFQLLPIAKSNNIKGNYWGALVMTRGLSWLPRFMRNVIIRIIEHFLFKSWKGKHFAGDNGYNLFGSKGAPKTGLPFLLSVKQSRDGSGLVTQLNYDIQANTEKYRKILGEARQVNESLHLAKMYYGKKLLVYYLLSQDGISQSRNKPEGKVN